MCVHIDAIYSNTTAVFSFYKSFFSLLYIVGRSKTLLHEFLLSQTSRCCTDAQTQTLNLKVYVEVY